ncbi:MAG: type II toxin-antitoxin system RelE/ParE family toxin [Rhodomicrobium sp.]
MPRFVLTPAAQANLIEIASYIESASGSVDAAERFIGRLLAKCEELAASPARMGRQRPELLPGLRSTPFRNYVIFFRYAGLPEAEVVFEVVNILERHRDIDAYFRRNPRSA